MFNKTSERIVIEGDSVLDGMLAARFYATIDLADPKKITLNTRHINVELCKERRDEVRADEVEFEDYAYALHDKVLAETTTE